MTTINELLVPNLWTSCNNNEIINNRILAQEQKTRIKKELFRIAEKELRENENVRNQCLETLRVWIEKNPDIENCIMDDNFLLRFLRVKKFSIPMAQQTLLKYLNFKNRFPQIMYELDYTDTKSNELIDNGYIFVSPFRDSYGRRVVLYDLSKLDIQRFNGNDMGKVHALTYENLLDDEENQILGVNHVANIGAIGPQHATLFSIAEFACLIRWGEQSFPMRHKDVNLLNLPTPLKYIYDFAKSNMSQKLRERLTVHDSIENLHQRVDRRCLPAEYGGKMSAKEMITMWKEELANKRQRLLSLDKIKLLSTRGIITKKNQPAQDDSGSLPGSFRKLELD